MKDHIHKYMRVVIGKNGFVVMKCMIPGCRHFISRELAVGRESICWKCGAALVLTMENTTAKKPVHDECKRNREEVA